MTDREKFIKIKLLADNLYHAMHNLTFDTKSIRQSMDDYHNFIILLDKDKI